MKVKKRFKIIAVLIVALVLCNSAYGVKEVKAEEVKEEVKETLDTKAAMEQKEAKEALLDADLYINGDLEGYLYSYDIGSTCELFVDVLQVPAGCEVKYSWYDENNNLLEGNTARKEIVISDEKKENRYICRVELTESFSGEVISMKDYEFDVWGNSLAVSCKINGKATDETEIESGKNVTVELSASSSLHRDITYKWYTSDQWESGDLDSPICAKNIYSFIKDETETQYYVCEITDGFSESIEYIYVYKKIPGKQWINDEETEHISCKRPNEKCKLEVRIESSTGELLKYQWMKWNDETEEYEVIPNANSSVYNAVKGIEDETIACKVSNPSGTEEELFVFFLNIRSLSATPRINGSYTYESSMTEGEHVTLSAEALSYYNPSGIQYKWYKRGEYNENTDEYTYEEIGKNKDLEIVKSGNEEEVYYCKMTDGLCTTSLPFWIGKTSIILDKVTMNGQEVFNLVCKEGEEVTMSVEASDSFTYKWYTTGIEDIAPNVIENATGNTLTVKKGEHYEENGREYYICNIYSGESVRTIRFSLENYVESSDEPPAQNPSEPPAGNTNVNKNDTPKVGASSPKMSSVSVKKASISKIKAGKKKITVKWKKPSKKINGYQIQYSTNKKFKKGVKTTTIKKYKTTLKTIKKLKSKKKYYVRIRTYKKVNGVKYYSKWSKTKAVKVK